MASSSRRSLLGGGLHQQATPAAKPPDQPWDYTPPSIPQPLPAPGGPIVQVVGPAPKRTTSANNTESPSSGATPGTSGTPGAVIPVNPSSPPQPAGATPVAAANQPAPSATVTLTPDFKFDPAQVTIAAGQAVMWTNQGRAPQTVTNDPARAKDKSHAASPGGAEVFDSGVLNAGASFTQVFKTPGTYSYFSQPQEQAGMVGTVVVQ